MYLRVQSFEYDNMHNLVIRIIGSVKSSPTALGNDPKKKGAVTSAGSRDVEIARSASVNKSTTISILRTIVAKSVRLPLHV